MRISILSDNRRLTPRRFRTEHPENSGRRIVSHKTTKPRPPGLYPKGLTSTVSSPSMRRDDSSFLLLIYGAADSGTDAFHFLFELIDTKKGHDIGGTVGDDANADERGERCCRDIRISKA